MFARFGLFFQPFDKTAYVRWIEMGAEPTAFLFELKSFRLFALKFFWNKKGLCPEVEEVSRDENKLLVFAVAQHWRFTPKGILLLIIVAGVFVVAACLFIGAGLRGLLPFEPGPAVVEVLPSRKPFIDAHCVNELSIASALSQVGSASTYDPISDFRKLNNIFSLFRALKFGQLYS